MCGSAESVPATVAQSSTGTGPGTHTTGCRDQGGDDEYQG
jgi:hypothetical protein